MKTILVAEDEFDLMRMLKAILERDGFAVETCTDGRQTLDRLTGAAAPPDLVLLDVMMPILSGLEVLRTLRGTGGLERIPVVLIGSVPPRAQREEYGWNAFLAKPFTLEALRSTIAKLLTDTAGPGKVETGKVETGKVETGKAGTAGSGPTGGGSMGGGPTVSQAPGKAGR